MRFSPFSNVCLLHKREYPQRKKNSDKKIIPSHIKVMNDHININNIDKYS